MKYMEVMPMFGWKSRPWFYPKPTGDPGRDRNARTIQFACLLLAFNISTIMILNLTSGQPSPEIPIQVLAVAGLVAAMITNRSGRCEWAARGAFLAVLSTAMLLVFEARDGFRSLAMLLFSGMLLISVMLLDRVSYLITAGVVLLAVTTLGIAERRGLTRAVPHVRSSTTYESILFVDLNLLIFAMIGSRLASDAQNNVFDLRATIDRVSKTNLTLEETADALRESEQQLVSVYNTVRDVIFHLAVEPDGRFRFVSVNTAFLRVTGLSQEAVIGKTVNEVIPEPSLTMVLGKYRQAIEENTAMVWEETSDYPAGRLIGEVSVVPVFENDGHCTHLVGSVHDISDRKRAETAIRESEERFRNIADTAPVLSWVSGPDKLLTFINRGWLTFTGSTLEQVVGDGWIEKMHPDDRDRCYTDYASAFDAHRIFQTECRLRRVDGEYRWMLTNGSPRFESSGAFVGFIGTCTDITDLKRSQEESLARQKLESLGVLAGGVAHDFNNLLGSVIANSELVLSELPDGSPAADGVESIKTVAERAAEIVRQMMSYAGQGDTVFEPVDLSGLLHEMVEFLKVSISKRATLNITLPKELPTVRANAAQLRQVILNLITNASEGLGEQEGVISITAARLRSGPTDNAPDLCRGDYVRLEVSDTGCGMTEEAQSKIFDPFFSTKFAGRGMGLAVVRGVVRSHGGAINVVSAPGQGSRFEILLPCSNEQARKGHHKTGSSAADVVSSSGTILMVEDEHSLRDPISKMLRRKGLTVFEAADGQVGASLFRDKASVIDVVLLDLTLPGLSGGEVLRELRQLQPDVTVIITSAYSREQAQAMLGTQLPWLYISKPYQVNELTDLLRDSIRAKRASG